MLIFAHSNLETAREKEYKSPGFDNADASRQSIVHSPYSHAGATTLVSPRTGLQRRW